MGFQAGIAQPGWGVGKGEEVRSNALPLGDPRTLTKHGETGKVYLPVW